MFISGCSAFAPVLVLVLLVPVPVARGRRCACATYATYNCVSYSPRAAVLSGYLAYKRAPRFALMTVFNSTRNPRSNSLETDTPYQSTRARERTARFPPQLNLAMRTKPIVL